MPDGTQVTNSLPSAEEQASVGDVLAHEQAVDGKAVDDNQVPLSVALVAIPMIAVVCWCLVYTVHVTSTITFDSNIPIKSSQDLLKAYHRLGC